MSRYPDESSIAQQPPTTGILLTNLGTPEAPTAKAVKRYLAEFLWDPRVIERPRWLWWLVLHGIILQVRPRRVARLYEKVWQDGGSPLMNISRGQATALQKEMERRFEGPVKVALAMRYGTPSIKDGLETLRAQNIERLVVLPLYPQYSATTTASTFDAVSDVLKHWRRVPELWLIRDYHDDPAYIRALAERVRAHWRQHQQGDRLLFSFHGLPKRYSLSGDPYDAQCHRTATLLAQELGLPQDRWLLAFQSRFGPEEWLKPYTDETLKTWAKKGVKRVDVIAPGFAADCLETLEEIAGTNKELFEKAGGQEYRYIPALNVGEDHIRMLADFIGRRCGLRESDTVSPAADE